MLWMLAREVRRMRGQDLRSQPWDVMMDLFLMRETTDENPEDAEGEAQEVPFEKGTDDAGVFVTLDFFSFKHNFFLNLFFAI